ncbi:MAG: DHA2 family efflux MFS transporter permease subunit [Eggerthellaceae bacterium]|nr:DHA2 family efflux MFS transporter permease subunit [Eggerthellaceae bacterium]
MTKTPNTNNRTASRTSAYVLFALVTIGSALGNMSQTGLNAMMPSTMAELGVQVDVGQWLTTGYMLMLGVAVPIATFLMRKLDDRRYAVLGFSLFAAGSLVDFIAPEFFTMLLGRILQAVSVGLLIPKMQTIVMTAFPPGRQATAMGIAGMALGFAPTIGPMVGGFMDYALGWRSFFLLLLALSAALLVLAILFVQRSGESSDDHFETPSFLLSTLGFGGVLLGLSQASSYGLKSAWVWTPITVGAVCLVLFVRRQSRVNQPLMDMRIFRSRRFVGGLLASVLLFGSYMGTSLVVPLFVQDLQGGTSLDTGLVLLPTVFTAMIVNPLSGVLADKTSPRLAALVFGTFLVVGSALSVPVDETTPLWLLSAYQTLRGIGVSGLVGPLTTFALAGLEGPLVAHGSSASVITRQVAATFGTAIMVFCMSALGPLVAAGSLAAALPYQASFVFSAVVAVMTLLVIITRVK